MGNYGHVQETKADGMGFRGSPVRIRPSRLIRPAAKAAGLCHIVLRIRTGERLSEAMPPRRFDLSDHNCCR
jgi:hypothetical protein